MTAKEFLEFYEKLVEEEKKIFTLKGREYCYSPDTEILTEDGWKNIKEYVLKKDKSKILALNPQTFEMEYVSPIAWLEFDFEGEMYHFYNKRSVDLLVTPYHRVFCRRIARKDANFDFFTACSTPYRKSPLIFKCGGGKFKGEKKDYFILEGVEAKTRRKIRNNKKVPIKLWLKFLALFLAEGWILLNHDEHYTIGIAQSPQGKAFKELEKILKEMSEIFHFKFFYDGKKQFYFGNKQLYEYLKQFGKSHDKYIPKEIKNLSPDLLKIFLYYYTLGDGYMENESYYQISTASEQMANDLQEIAIKIGKYATIRKYKNIFLIYIGLSNKYSYDRMAFLEKIPYKGKVYDVTLEKFHLLYVRRNYKGCWSSNSGEINRFSNFERIAEELGLHPIEVLWVYATKHKDSISTFIKEKKVHSNEDIIGRIHDLRNYLALLAGLIVKCRNLPKEHKWKLEGGNSNE